MSPTDETDRWRPWSENEREDFFVAIARRRRSAWRVTALCALATGTLALVMAVLLAPLLWGLLGLVFDLVNLLIPVPDPLSFIGRSVAPLLDDGAPTSLSILDLIAVTALAAAPGLVLMGLAVRTLRRAFRQSAMFDPARIGGRAPDPRRLAEQRFANTVVEMALAAALPAPRVLVLDGGGNAAAFGPDDGHATVLIGRRLIDSLTRDQMQGVAGHLVASIANGDIVIGMRTALTLGLFALLARLAGAWSDRAAFQTTRRLLRALSAPTTAHLELIMEQLADPFGGQTTESDHPRVSPGASGKSDGEGLSWREWASMPLMGPVFFGGFLGGFVSSLMLGPAIALAWRQRKYMADATAVRLTRDPNALAGALMAIHSTGDAAPAASWAGHLCVVDPGTRTDAGLLTGAIVSIFPSTERRLAALVALGAEPPPATRRRPRMSGPVLLLVAVLVAILASLLGLVVVLLVWVSVAISMLFTILPLVWLHILLR